MKKKTTPKYKTGDSVKSTFPDYDLLKINCEPFWNGFTWMYGFEGNTLVCGEEYLTLVAPAIPPAPEQPQGQQKEWYIKEFDSVLIPFEIWSGDKEMCEVHWGIKSKYPETIEEVRANAARIVQCVNVHDELVEALRGLIESSKEYVSFCINKRDAYVDGGDNYKMWDRRAYATSQKIKKSTDLLAKATQS